MSEEIKKAPAAADSKPEVKPPTETKTVYCFVGSANEVGSRRLNRIGQTLELTPSEAKELMQKVALLPQSDFDKIGFTKEDLQKHSRPENRPFAPESFNERVAAAQERYRELRKR